MSKVIVFSVLLVINLISFITYGIDKYKAKVRAWRIPEKVLLGLAFLGGGMGAFLGMRVFHHKTKHWYFKVFVPLFLITQIGLLTYALYKGIIT